MQVANSLLLDALRGENEGRPPVWLMRQAGRYMPSYRVLRKQHSLKTLFLTPELAAKITLLPINELGVDAAILFSDITVVALALGLELDFAEGPQVSPLLTSEKMDRITFAPERLDPIIEAVRLTVPELKVPLIGFCGGPFTVATYLVEGGIEGARRWAAQSPETFHTLLGQISKISSVYLQRQIDAGAGAVQIFDSWANVLTKSEFSSFCVPYYEQMIASVSTPVIVFMREASRYLEELRPLSCALSMDWHTPLWEIRRKTAQVLQGNLDPQILYEPYNEIQKKARELKKQMTADAAWIAGLGHGLRPDMDYHAVKMLIQTLQEEG